MKIRSHGLLIGALVCACQPATTWASQMEGKHTDAHKRQHTEIVNHQGPSVVTRETLQKEATLCRFSRRAQLKATLYELLDSLPIELINIIVSYDSHILTGRLQCALNCPIQQKTAAIVSLTHSKNENIFYAQTDSGLNYWCNAATGIISTATPMRPKKKQKRTDGSLKAPRLIRSNAIVHQAVALPDGSIVRAYANEITVISPTIDNKSTLLCTFKPGLVTKLLALSDGRLVTGMPNGQIKLWV